MLNEPIFQQGHADSLTEKTPVEIPPISEKEIAEIQVITKAYESERKHSDDTDWIKKIGTSEVALWKNFIVFTKIAPSDIDFESAYESIRSQLADYRSVESITIDVRNNFAHMISNLTFEMHIIHRTITKNPDLKSTIPKFLAAILKKNNTSC